MCSSSFMHKAMLWVGEQSLPVHRSTEHAEFKYTPAAKSCEQVQVAACDYDMSIEFPLALTWQSTMNSDVCSSLLKDVNSSCHLPLHVCPHQETIAQTEW